jgi:hypothetical protein
LSIILVRFLEGCKILKTKKALKLRLLVLARDGDPSGTKLEPDSREYKGFEELI